MADPAPGTERSAITATAATRLTALTALAPMSWGTTYLVTTEWLPPDRPLLSGTIRALPAGLLALALSRTLPRGDWWWRAAVLGTLNIGAFFALLFVAAYRLPGGVAATLGWAVLEESLTPAQQAGFAVALLSVVAAQLPPRRRVVAEAAAAPVNVPLADSSVRP